MFTVVWSYDRDRWVLMYDHVDIGTLFTVSEGGQSVSLPRDADDKEVLEAAKRLIAGIFSFCRVERDAQGGESS